MKRSIKTLLIVLMLICTFSYMGVVKAASSDFLVKENSAEVKTALVSLLEGKELTSSDKAILSDLKDTYTFYYKIAEVDSAKYEQYNSGDTSVAQEIANSIAVPKSTDELSDWKTVDFNTLKIDYDNLNWSSDSSTPYLVALTAVETSTGSIYNYRGIYESASPSTLVAISAKQQANTDQPENDDEGNSNEEGEVEKENPDSEDLEDSEEKAESNPETGVSDYAIYLVPLSLIAGSTLMLKRRNA